ncbi:MAG: alpha/beta hydrolase-fold protein, partial [Acidobacteriaceae bacterium]
MVVGSPSVDSNGVKYYPVTSVYQGSDQQIIRVLEPTNPVAGKPRRILYVLPVDEGVDTTDSTWSDGLEELRMLDVQDRFNMTLIAPSFNYSPWYGDNVTAPSLRMESFIIDDLVPWGDTFLKGTVPQRYLIGFSKSGTGVLDLILRHPSVFNAAAAWDSPAQQSSLSASSDLPMNFGTQANYNTYYIPSLVANNAAAFTQQNRLWISGDQAAWTADMDLLNTQMNAAGIAHTWVAGPTRVHSWSSGWLNGAVTDLDANATNTAPIGEAMAPPRSGGWPGGTFASGTTQTTLTLKTDQKATCRYSTTAGTAFSSMANTFTTTGGTAHSTVVSGLQSNATYNFNVRCQDTASGIVNPDDYVISFSVAAVPSSVTVSSSFAGAENPLSENGMWSATGSWNTLQKSTGAYTTQDTSAARLATPSIPADQFSEITFDQNPGANSWPGVMTRVQGVTSGSGYLAIANSGEVYLYRIDDGGSLGFTWLGDNNAPIGTAPRRLRLESQGNTHRVYFNGTLLITATDSVYTGGQPGIADAVEGGPTVKILTFSGGALNSGPDTTPPVRSNGAPTGSLASGTTTATLALATNEAATCRYSTTAGVAYASMTKTFGGAGTTSQSTTVTGLTNGTTYNYYVRCQDTAGNANPDDYLITFSVKAADTTPPVRSAGSPTGTLAVGTTQTAMSLVTNEAATCRYSTTAGVAYASMTKTFSGAGTTSQSTTVTGLTNGTTYNYYVRCQDTA